MGANIPANSNLIFDVALVDFAEKKKDTNAIEEVQQHRSQKQSSAEDFNVFPMNYVVVDLGTRGIALKACPWCCCYIADTTVKWSRERAELIRSMAKYEFVPSKRGLYINFRGTTVQKTKDCLSRVYGWMIRITIGE